MALIIKGDMPKACNWFDENGKHRFCKVNAFCDCRIYTRGERPSDCPIIGEIPEEHGELMDKKAFFESEKGRTIIIGRAGERVIRELYERIAKAPAVVEAST